jgi:hypothetical protein
MSIKNKMLMHCLFFYFSSLIAQSNWEQCEKQIYDDISTILSELRCGKPYHAFDSIMIVYKITVDSIGNVRNVELKISDCISIDSWELKLIQAYLIRQEYPCLYELYSSPEEYPCRVRGVFHPMRRRYY